MSALVNVPGYVRERLARALAELRRIETERAGYKRMGLGTRFDDDLTAAAAPHRVIVADFRELAAGNGVDPEAAITELGGEAGPQPDPVVAAAERSGWRFSHETLEGAGRMFTRDLAGLVLVTGEASVTWYLRTGRLDDHGRADDVARALAQVDACIEANPQ